MTLKNAPDLTKQAPRSPRVRLGGYVILPRMLDKGRALINGNQGEYHYACPTDEQFLEFVGVDPKEVKKQLAAGKGDGEILAWIEAKAKHRRTPSEIASWSEFQERRVPGALEGREFFHGIHAKIGAKRDDICTWFDLLDLDDYVSYGGKA